MCIYKTKKKQEYRTLIALLKSISETERQINNIEVRRFFVIHFPPKVHGLNI